MVKSTGTRTLWRVLAWGCGGLVLVGLVAAGGIAWIVAVPTLQAKADVRDPGALESRAQRYLRAVETPEGYYPAVARSVPFLMQMTFLSDRPEAPLEAPWFPNADERADLFDQSAFLYLKTPWEFLNPLEELHEARLARLSVPEPNEAMTEGERFLHEVDQRYRDSILAEGEIAAGGGRIHYVAQLGPYGRWKALRYGITTDLFIHCGDGDSRYASWKVPVPGAEDGERVDVLPPELRKGTPADEEALRAFLDHFDFCR